MRNAKLVLAGVMVSVVLVSYLAMAQQPAAPSPPMTFFATSVGKGDGGNLGGLAGADAHCQMLARAVGRGDVTWHAYLSTQGPNAVNARDRIGRGPWHNQKGQLIAKDLAELHGDTVELARLGNGLGKQSSLTEKGDTINGYGDTPNEHDIMTGTQPDGRAYADTLDHTCNNWTSNKPIGINLVVSGLTNSAQLGHSDKRARGYWSWNSAHPSVGCTQANIVASGGIGALYCFAVN